MRKTLLIVCLILTLFTLSSCTSSGASSAQETEKASVTETPAPTPTEAPTPEPLVIDLDIAGMSGTIVSSQMLQIMTSPDDYLGKVLRISGYYSRFEDPVTHKVYHSCVIPDATACCSQGLEFVLREAPDNLAGYPEEGTNITVSGRLDSYLEDGYMYLTLTDAEMVLPQV